MTLWRIWARRSVSLLITAISDSETLSVLKILTKSAKVMRSSVLPFSSLVRGSRALTIFLAKFESEERPRETSGLMTSSASRTPDMSPSQVRKRSLANWTTLRWFSASSV